MWPEPHDDYDDDDSETSETIRSYDCTAYLEDKYPKECMKQQQFFFCYTE